MFRNWVTRPPCDPHFISQQAKAQGSVRRVSGFVQTGLAETGLPGAHASVSRRAAVSGGHVELAAPWLPLPEQQGGGTHGADDAFGPFNRCTARGTNQQVLLKCGGEP
jgi:hypothetical protein